MKKNVLLMVCLFGFFLGSCQNPLVDDIEEGEKNENMTKISITLKLPSGVNVDGKPYVCVLDNDDDSTNGDVKKVDASWTSGEMQEIAFQDIQKGKYFLRAMVDVDGNQGEPNAGDYAATLQNIEIVDEQEKKIDLNLSLVEAEGGGGTEATLTGSITLNSGIPAEIVNGKVCRIVLDNDGDLGNGSIMSVNVTWTSGSLSYSIPAVPYGTYFIYSFTDMGAPPINPGIDYASWTETIPGPPPELPTEQIVIDNAAVSWSKELVTN